MGELSSIMDQMMEDDSIVRSGLRHKFFLLFDLEESSFSLRWQSRRAV